MLRKHPFAPGTIHHVYSRGVAKLPIFKQEADYWRFMQGLCLFNDRASTSSILWHIERNRGRLTMHILKDYVTQQEHERNPLVRILAYCAMGNHYHLLLEEIREGGITQFMHKLGTGYARYFNNKHDRSGVLFQSRFRNVLVEDKRYLQYVLVYINVLNPLGITKPNWKEEGIHNIEEALAHAENYQFSSHLDYLGKRGSLILDKGILAKLLPTPDAYADLVKSVLEEKKYQAIDHLTLESD